MNDLEWKDTWLERELDSSWISNFVDHNLEKYFDSLQILPKNVLEVGCGDGLNSIFLYKKGCNVDAIDISDFAIDIAKKRYRDINYICDDFISTDKLQKKYDLIFDKGCFHGTANQIGFIKKISSLLSNGGIWFSVIGSSEGREKTDSKGPPKHDIDDLVSVINPHMKILSIEATTLVHKKEIHSPAWRIISSNRKT